MKATTSRTAIPMCESEEHRRWRRRADPTKTISDRRSRDALKDFSSGQAIVVIGRRGEMGRCAVVLTRWIDGYAELAALCSAQEIVRPRFISVLLSSPEVKAHLEQMAIGVTLRILIRKSFLTSKSRCRPWRSNVGSWRSWTRRRRRWRRCVRCSPASRPKSNASSTASGATAPND